ncbi:hypothetical protein TVAG_195280 [Trichomonas vaginalis G3]|uniref:Uncharacterized protein n=1 Tax=Trichomonas vaginalis (strain ATCC PRA-98 / G3) TaxID=412133 RepID=A2FLX8_TRIV3|nr:centrosomal protein 2 family [Trichomonas vaginalis G3]EAX94067.1 hypothetical protein TVAG_195280 [Trichomonas vaginalis G3]KAI5488057.1 centrosomal protein 2 family [Trichomonas vaginalis G3]|eukprot:XP_001306997.1 hypothetical protein [Trichomonas vaginalis G3]
MERNHRHSKQPYSYKSESKPDNDDYPVRSHNHRSKSTAVKDNNLLPASGRKSSVDSSNPNLSTSAADFMAICETLTKRKITNLNDSINVLNDLVASNKKSQLQVKLLQSSKKDLITKLNSATQEVQNLKNMIKDQKFDAPRTTLQIEIQNLKKKLTEKDATISQLTEELNHHKSVNATLLSEQALQNSKSININDKLKKTQDNEQSLIHENTKFVKQIAKLRQQLEKYQKINIDDFHNLKSDYSKLKKLHNQLHDDYDQLSAENAQLQNRILELEKENQEIHEKILAPLETHDSIATSDKPTEIEKLQKQNSSLLQNINLSEDVIASQRDEIIKAYESRNTMSKFVQRLFKVLQTTENLAKEYKDKYDTLMYKVEEEKQNFEVQREKLLFDFTSTFEQIIEIVPMDITEPITNDTSKTEYEQLKAIVQALINTNGARTSSGNVENTPDLPEEYEKLKKRYMNLYCFLDNTLLFIRKIANTNDVDERLFIQQHIARIAIFIDQNKPDHVIYYPSPYESTDLNEALQIVHDFIDDDLSKQSPFLEVVAILSAMCTANAMLMENAEINKRRVIELKDNATVNENLRAMANEAKKLVEREETLKMIFSQMLGDEDVDPVEWIKENIHDMFVENKYAKDKLAEMKGKIDTLRTAAQQEIKKLEAERDMFCEKASKLSETIQQEILAAKVEFAQKLQDHQKLVEETANSNKEQLEEALKTSTEEHEKEMQDYKQRNGELQSAVDELLNRVAKLTMDVQEREELIAELHTEHQDYALEKETQVNELMKVSKALMKKHKDAKRKIVDVNQTMSKMIKEIQDRNDQTIESYKKDIFALTERLKNSQDDSQKSSDKVHQLEEKINGLQEQIAKLTLSERNLKHKYNTLSDQVVRERESLDASKAALSAAFESNHKAIVSEKEKEIQMAKEFIAKVAREIDTGIKTEDLIAKATKNLENREESPVIKAGIEALQLKREFQIPNDKPLSDTMRNLVDAKDIANRELETYTDKLKKTELELSKVKRELAKSCAAIADNKEWMNWARTMYMNVTCGGAPMYNAQDLRYLLQESLLTEIGFGSLTKKVDILRTEKACLLSPLYKVATNYNKNHSIRTALLIVLFANRVQSSSNMMPTRFARIQTEEGKD